MGILNLTPDSFYDGGSYKNETDVLNKVENYLNQGATFIDVGAYSTRPNAEAIDLEEELKRSVKLVQLICCKFPEVIISIDTFRAEVAKQCIHAGAALVNDISAGHLDDNMLQTVADLHVPYIMMHMRGTPQTMQQQIQYGDMIKEIIHYFSERIYQARQLGIIDIIADPGFGFAKTLEQNFHLLNNMELLKMLDLPLLVGVSRKSIIYKTLDISAQEALNGTTALNMVALQKGASILRVHDVKEAMECIKLYQQLKA
ncbi:dihydropteroate synthase [Mangrovimonas aestuarii]|uniref:dihydropteroate synthase n=1 Tax=Mangrovimonas aestuarii TaxID=3018443 RepID=UPI002378DA24|nr:dihydropteroate synthase [Mangrovimonas aestuarii]